MTPLIKTLLGAGAGAAIGFLVYRFIGCRTGTCPITANPWLSMIFGAVIGFLMTSGK